MISLLKRLIPARHHYALADIKNALGKGYRKDFYSQFGEDIVLSKLFTKRDGFYVDVGAHHPKRYSNTYLLHKRGWTGINIDANPDSTRLFARARPGDRTITVGIGKGGGSLAYHQFSDPAVNTFRGEDAERWKEKNWITYLGATEVPVRTLAEVLSEAGELPPIDVLTVDVEGMDTEVLESNDWERFRPEVVVAESHAFMLEQPTNDPAYRLLSGKGYVLVAKTGPSLIFTQAKPA